MCLLHRIGTRPSLATDGIHPLLDTVNGAEWGEGHMTQSELIGMFLKVHGRGSYISLLIPMFLVI